MTVQLAKVLQDAKTLSAAERAELAHCLLSSLEEPENEDVTASWLAEVEQRIQAFEAGQQETVSWEKMRKELSRS